MTRFDGPCMIFYWSATVTIAYLVPFSCYLTLNNIVTLKSCRTNRNKTQWLLR